MATRGTCLAIGLLACLPACQTVSETDGVRQKGYDLLGQKDYSSSVSHFERAASLATNPEEKAKAYLGVGRVHLHRGDPRTALRYFYTARATYHSGDLESETNRALGQAYFRLGDYTLSRRYLAKGLERTQGEEHELTLAMLVVCAKGTGDADGATAYRTKLEQPCSPEVRAILAMDIVTPEAPAVEPGDLARSWSPEERGEPTVPREKGEEGERLLVISRDKWNATSVHQNIEPMGRVDKITVHHSGGEVFWGTSKAAAAAEIRRIQRYHQNDQHWADIGYHYIIDRAGNVWQGRRLRYQGAHARGSANCGNIGIVLLGNFCHQSVPAAQRHSLELLVVKLCDYFSVPPERVYTHREIVNGKTDCPGPGLSPIVRGLRTDLRRKLVAYRKAN